MNGGTLPNVDIYGKPWEDESDHGFPGGNWNDGGWNGSGGWHGTGGMEYTPPAETNGGSEYSTSASFAGYFIMNNNDQQQYPAFTSLVRNLSSFAKSDPKIMEAIRYYTKLTDQQIAQHLNFNSGPTLVIAKELPAVALFRSSTPNTLYVAESEVRAFENASFNISHRNAMSFFLAVSLLHEYVHYGDNLNVVKFLGEEGTEFENRAWGVTVDQFNSYYLNKYYQ